MSVRSTLRRGFVTGLVLVAPLAVTLVVIGLVYSWLVGLLTPVLLVVYPGEVDPVVQLVSLVVVVLLVTALGLVFHGGVGRRAVTAFDRLMEAIPFVSPLYAGAREASNALTRHQDRFNRVALVEWPESGLHTVGFVTSETTGRAAAVFDDDERRYDVFVPMAPNPMGGFLAIVPESRLRMTDLSVSEGIQLVLTTGMSGAAGAGEGLDVAG